MLLSDKDFLNEVRTNLITNYECVHEVPKLTIDFSDGKQIRRTLKGNTVLYLCRADGTVIDAWPGVYTPRDFLPQLRSAIAWNAKNPSANPMAYHSSQNDSAAKRTSTLSMSKSAVESPPLNSNSQLLSRSKSFVESSFLSAPKRPISVSKFAIEGPVTTEVPRGRASFDQNPTGPQDPLIYAEFMRRTEELIDVSNLPFSPAQLRVSMAARTSTANSPRMRGAMAVELDSKSNLETVRPIVHLYLRSWLVPPTPQQCKIDFFKHLLKVDLEDPYLGLADFELPGTPNVLERSR